MPYGFNEDKSKAEISLKKKVVTFTSPDNNTKWLDFSKYMYNIINPIKEKVYAVNVESADFSFLTGLYRIVGMFTKAIILNRSLYIDGYTSNNQATMSDITIRLVEDNTTYVAERIKMMVPYATNSAVLSDGRTYTESTAYIPKNKSITMTIYYFDTALITE